MPKLSITYQGFRDLVDAVAPQIKSVRFTSHDMRAIFRGEVDHPKFTRSRFHPLDKFAECYSDRPPDYAISYPWDLDLLSEVTEFFQAFKSKLHHAGASEFDEATFWIDIAFIDQNNQNMERELSHSQDVYRTAIGHLLFLAKRPLARGWILFELAFRLFSIMSEFGIAFEDMLRYLTLMVGDVENPGSEMTHCNKFKSRSTFNEYSLGHILEVSFPQIIVCNGVTNLQTDLYDYCGRETFKNMKTCKSEDKKMLQKRLELLLGSETKFDQIINQLSIRARLQVLPTFLMCDLSKTKLTLANSSVNMTFLTRHKRPYSVSRM
jgi:hypothetical protein